MHLVVIIVITLSVMKSSSKLNLSSPIYQSPIRGSKRSDTLKLPIGLTASSFKGEFHLTQKPPLEYSNIENFYEDKKICCPNCRYIFNFAVNDKVLEVLSKQKMTQTEFQIQVKKVEQKIDLQLERTAKQLGMKTKSVLLMEKLIDISKSRIPKAEESFVEEKGQKSKITSSSIPLQQFKYKQIQLLLKYARQFLRQDVPSYIKLMFQDTALWQRPKATSPAV